MLNDRKIDKKIHTKIVDFKSHLLTSNKLQHRIGPRLSLAASAGESEMWANRSLISINKWERQLWTLETTRNHMFLWPWTWLGQWMFSSRLSSLLSKSPKAVTTWLYSTRATLISTKSKSKMVISMIELHPSVKYKIYNAFWYFWCRQPIV